MRIRLLKSIGTSVGLVSVLVFSNPAEMAAQSQNPTVSMKSPAAAFGDHDALGRTRPPGYLDR